MYYLVDHHARVLQLTEEHLRLVALSVAIALLIGLPIGILLTRLHWLEGPIVGTTGVLYTVPSLALFAILIPYTGLGTSTATIALALYSLLPIVRNTVAGINGVPPAALDAARGMGMTGSQRLLLVELPLALPVILAGLRVATVAAVGIATIASLVGAGGLGLLIFEGIRTLDADKVVAGAVAASVLALAADWGLGLLGDLLRRDTRAATGRG